MRITPYQRRWKDPHPIRREKTKKFHSVHKRWECSYARLIKSILQYFTNKTYNILPHVCFLASNSLDSVLREDPFKIIYDLRKADSQWIFLPTNPPTPAGTSAFNGVYTLLTLWKRFQMFTIFSRRNSVKIYFQFRQIIWAYGGG